MGPVDVHRGKLLVRGARCRAAGESDATALGDDPGEPFGGPSGRLLQDKRLQHDLC
jgi:hypothetical protein